MAAPRGGVFVSEKLAFTFITATFDKLTPIKHFMGLPGYEGLLLAKQVVLKEGSVSTGLYFNHDKVLVAWSLLNWLPLFARSTKAAGAMPAWSLPPLVVGGVLVIMGLAVVLNLVAWQPGLTEWFWVFAIANLLNTCIAEELLFRGMLQRWLMERFGVGGSQWALRHRPSGRRLGVRAGRNVGGVALRLGVSMDRAAGVGSAGALGAQPDSFIVVHLFHECLSSRWQSPRAIWASMADYCVVAPN